VGGGKGINMMLGMNQGNNGCNFTWLGQMVSIILKFNEISVVFPERRHIFPKMHRIFLEVIINTFKPVKSIALYCCFDKPMISGKFVITVIRPTVLKMSIEVILFLLQYFKFSKNHTGNSHFLTDRVGTALSVACVTSLSTEVSMQRNRRWKGCCIRSNPQKSIF